MMLLEGKTLESITADDILTLVRRGEAEGKTLEYKQALPGGGDSEKKEFLADVSSFANAAGGYLICGIEEKRDAQTGQGTGIPGCVCGIAEGELDEAAMRALDDLIRGGIEPRIPGVGLHKVLVEGSGTVLVIRVPPSWLSPHRVAYKGKGHGRFYSRHVNGKYPLDVDELRTAFLHGETRSRRVVDFRDRRLALIVAGETPVPVQAAPRLVIHLVPVALEEAFDLTDLVRESLLTERPSAPMRHRHNFDGALAWYDYKGGRPAPGYIQVFRNGAVEVVDTDVLRADTAHPNLIEGACFERELAAHLRKLLVVQRALGVMPPIAVMLALLGIKGRFLSCGRNPTSGLEAGLVHPIEKENLILPEALVESFDAAPIPVLRPIIDLVWNACGYEGSLVKNQSA
jgi:hypothetical protein